MKRLEVFICLLGASLFAAPALGSHHWPGAPDFCHDKECPEYTVIETNEDFEERAYHASRWITTKVSSSGTLDLAAGFYRLKYYCEGENEKRSGVPRDSWPGLITITEGEDGTETELYMSWFVPLDTEAPTPTDTAVQVIDRPAETVYVRVFDGSISHTAGQENVKHLRDDLKNAGKAFEPLKYTGAAYEGRFYIFRRHNEIWIKATVLE